MAYINLDAGAGFNAGDNYDLGDYSVNLDAGSGYDAYEGLMDYEIPVTADNYNIDTSGLDPILADMYDFDMGSWDTKYDGAFTMDYDDGPKDWDDIDMAGDFADSFRGQTIWGESDDSVKQEPQEDTERKARFAAWLEKNGQEGEGKKGDEDFWANIFKNPGLLSMIGGMGAAGLGALSKQEEMAALERMSDKKFQQEKDMYAYKKSFARTGGGGGSRAQQQADAHNNALVGLAAITDKSRRGTWSKR